MGMCKIGTVVRLKCPCLGNPKGTLGVCYEVYDLGWGKGASVIFQNGCYDGFSNEEQEVFLEKIEDTSFTYNFQNVMALSNDFSKGAFREVLDMTSGYFN